MASTNRIGTRRHGARPNFLSHVTRRKLHWPQLKNAVRGALPSITKGCAILRDAKLNESSNVDFATVTGATTSSKLSYDWMVLRYDQEPVLNKYQCTATIMKLEHTPSRSVCGLTGTKTKVARLETPRFLGLQRNSYLFVLLSLSCSAAGRFTPLDAHLCTS